MKHTDLVGQVFSNLTVKEFAGISKEKRALWLCLCSCGNSKIVSGKHLRRKEVQSCGCLRGTVFTGNAYATKHGQAGRTKSREYKSWRAMKARCMNPNNPAYKNYGGRGITVFPEWVQSFEAFYRDMGERPEGKTLDRVNNDLGYFPNNCRWATPKEQIANQRKRHATS
jgi:hypothetical protein